MPTEQCVIVYSWYLWLYITKYGCAFFNSYAANLDRRTGRRRERRAAESSEQRETRLARRRVADRARFATISR